jgi:hypothetical protein
VPAPQMPLEAGDELIMVATTDRDAELDALLAMPDAPRG